MINLNEIVSLLVIGISLSMDAFSLALSLSTITKQKNLFFIVPLTVGIFHFFMPLLGNFIGIKLINILSLTTNKVLGIILIILGINLAIHYFKDEDFKLNFSLIGILLFALSVSLDSFSVGLGISAITTKNYLASIIFAFCSATFTYLGLVIGKYSSKLFGKYANIIGIFLLLLLGILHLIQ